MGADLRTRIDVAVRSAATGDFAERWELSREFVGLRDGLRSLPSSEREAWSRRMDEAADVLRTRDRADLERLGHAIRSGLRGAELAAELVQLAGFRDSAHHGDTALDALFEGLIGVQGAYDGLPAPSPELIHYDPSPASVVLALHAAGFFDEGERFVDIGAGIGRVTVIGALLGPARVLGLEITPELVDVADRAARRLGSPALHRIADARVDPLGEGTRVFLGAPFVGSVLADVLDRLRRECDPSRLRIASWGPSTAPMARVSWLEAQGPTGPFDLAIFRPRL